MAGIRVRAGENPTAVWASVKQRLTLPGDPTRRRAGDTRPLAELVAMRSGPIELPVMIALSDRISIMKGELTGGLFNQVMEGYEITGHNATSLKALLTDDSRAGEALTYVSLLDAREFARRLSAQTGRSFRIQTEAEWEQARSQLSGNNWTWTETPHLDYSGAFVLRRLVYDYRSFAVPGFRDANLAVRLVEDL